MDTSDQQSAPLASPVAFGWKIPEYIKYSKNIWWYVISAALLIGSVTWLIIIANYTFAILLVLFYLTVLLFEHRPVEEIDFIITPDGVKVGTKFYWYKELDHFFIVYRDNGLKKLYLEFRNPLRGRIAAPLDGQDPVAIRDYLLRSLREDLDRQAEPISDFLTRWLRL